MVNTETTSTYDLHGSPKVTALENGGFIVSYAKSDYAGNLGHIDAFQRFDASCNKVGSEIIVSNSKYQGNALSFPDNSFVFLWYRIESGFNQIFLQKFDASGNTVGSEILVNTRTTSSHHITPSVGLVADRFSDNSFVVVYNSASEVAGDFNDVYFQRFDFNGTKIGTETLINEQTVKQQNQVNVKVLSDDTFITTWSSTIPDQTANHIMAQLYSASGIKIG